MLKTHFARVFFVKYQHIFPLHEGVCLCGHARHGAPRWPTSGSRNFCASGRNRTKPPPNENYEFIFSFDEGFVWFWQLDQKLWPPEVGQDFRKKHRCMECVPVAVLLDQEVAQKSKYLENQGESYQSDHMSWFLMLWASSEWNMSKNKN